MASLDGGFDASGIEPAKPQGEIVPPGKYTVAMVRSTRKPTTTGGELLELEFDVIEGEFKGRKLWDRLNLWNSNPQAAEIANRTLSAICYAVAVLQVSNTEQLHYKPMLVTVRNTVAGPDKKGVQRESKNEIKGYEKAGVGGGASYTPPAPATGGFKAPATAAGAAPAVATPARVAPWRQAS